MSNSDPVGCDKGERGFAERIRAGNIVCSIQCTHASGMHRILSNAVAVVAAALMVAVAPNVGVAGPVSGGADRTPSVESEYKLDALDKIRVMVFEWRPSLDEVFEWKALNSEYTIGPTGKLALPLVGEILVSGSSTSELAVTIGERLKARMGLVATPDIAVEVVQFRPFYVVGSVQKPGEYPFRPGLTVLQALSISGGLLRKPGAGLNRLGRESLSGRGKIDLLNKEGDTLMVLRARLEAELNHENEIIFPPELLARSGDSEVATARLLEQEKLVFKARKEAFDTQSRILRQLRDYLEKEVVSVTGQIAYHKRRIDLFNAELAGVTKLESKGLLRTPIKLALQRDLARMEGDGMRLNGALLKIQQEISKTEISMIELENERSRDVTTELRQTNIKLEQVLEKLETAAELLYETEVIAPMRIAEYSRGRKIEPQLKIARRVGGQFIEIVAGENTAMRPGDTLKVEIPLRFNDGSAVEGEVGELGDPPSLHSPKRAALGGLKKRFGD